MSTMASQITQPFIQARMKENIKAPRDWALWGEFTGTRKMFPFDDVIMWKDHLATGSSMWNLDGIDIWTLMI